MGQDSSSAKVIVYVSNTPRKDYLVATVLGKISEMAPTIKLNSFGWDHTKKHYYSNRSAQMIYRAYLEEGSHFPDSDECKKASVERPVIIATNDPDFREKFLLDEGKYLVLRG